MMGIFEKDKKDELSSNSLSSPSSISHEHEIQGDKKLSNGKAADKVGDEQHSEGTCCKP